MQLTLAQLADKYRNQRDVLLDEMKKIVAEDAEGRGFFAKIAVAAIDKMNATTELGSPEQR